MLKKMIAMAILLSCISACDPTVKKYLGVDDKIPDEYGIVKNKPLSMPPDFSLLPPEQAGKKSSDVAKTSQDSSLTTSDNIFLKKAEKSLAQNSKTQTVPKG